MATFTKLICTVENCKEKATRMIFVKNRGYGLCDKHFEILKDLRQIRLGK